METRTLTRCITPQIPLLKNTEGSYIPTELHTSVRMGKNFHRKLECAQSFHHNTISSGILARMKKHLQTPPTIILSRSLNRTQHESWWSLRWQIVGFVSTFQDSAKDKYLVDSATTSFDRVHAHLDTTKPFSKNRAKSLAITSICLILQ